MEGATSTVTATILHGSAAHAGVILAKVERLPKKTGGTAATKAPQSLDFLASKLLRAPHLLKVDKTLAADRDPKRYKEIPEVNTRQRVAPSGAFWLCVLFFGGEDPTLRSKLFRQCLEG